MKKKCVTQIPAFFLVFVLLFGSCPVFAAPSQPSAWAAAEVGEAVAAGLVPEDLQADYQNGITRLDFCRLTVTLLEKYTGAPIETLLSKRGVALKPDVFKDTDDASVLAANALGVVNGVGNGLFAPEKGINRAEAAALLMRAANLMGNHSGLPYVYDDARHIPSWARESVYAARESGIMSGTTNNEFLPNGSYTREASILTMLRTYKLLRGELAVNPNLFPMCADIAGTRLWGYVDKSGSFVIAPKYVYASEWNDGFGIVATPEDPQTCFVINAKGERVEAGQRFAGEFPLININPPSVCFFGNYMHVLYGGRDIVVTSFSEGMLGLWLQDYQHYLKRDGTSIPAGYWGGAFFDGVAVIYGPLDFKYHVIDKNGKTLYTSDLDANKNIIISGSFGQVGDYIVTSRAVKNGNYYDMDQVIDKNGVIHSYFGVIRADGRTIFPAENDYVLLTPFKQILVSKTGEPYTLYNSDGKAIYKFPDYMTGALRSDSIGNYCYRASPTEAIVLSTAGEVVAKIGLSPDAEIEFISGMIRVVDSSGCKYYDVTGKQVIGQPAA